MPSFIRNVIYNLKRNYGQKVVVYRKSTNYIDLESGKVKISRLRFIVNKAIVLVSKDYLKFSHDITPKIIGRQFNYGGFFGQSDRMLILDRRDLPKDYELKTDDYFIIKNKRYDIYQVHQYEDNTAYVLTIRQMSNEPLEQIVSFSIKDSLIMRQDSFNPVSRSFSISDFLTLSSIGSH